MKTGKITAKLRDAVPVCLMVNGEEVKRYKNIELPDELKEVEMTDFHFNVHMDLSLIHIYLLSQRLACRKSLLTSECEDCNSCSMQRNAGKRHEIERHESMWS